MNIKETNEVQQTDINPTTQKTKDIFVNIYDNIFLFNMFLLTNLDL